MAVKSIGTYDFPSKSRQELYGDDQLVHVWFQGNPWFCAAACYRAPTAMTWADFWAGMIIPWAEEDLARLAEGRTAFDAMRATFPAGTVSGAPKVRALPLIGKLETSRTGFYSGIGGTFGFDVPLDSCIALRSIVTQNLQALLPTGDGVGA